VTATRRQGAELPAGSGASPPTSRSRSASRTARLRRVLAPATREPRHDPERRWRPPGSGPLTGILNAEKREARGKEGMEGGGVVVPKARRRTKPTDFQAPEKPQGDQQSGRCTVPTTGGRLTAAIPRTVRSYVGSLTTGETAGEHAGTAAGPREHAQPGGGKRGSSHGPVLARVRQAEKALGQAQRVSGQQARAPRERRSTLLRRTVVRAGRPRRSHLKPQESGAVSSPRAAGRIRASGVLGDEGPPTLSLEPDIETLARPPSRLAIVAVAAGCGGGTGDATATP